MPLKTPNNSNKSTVEVGSVSDVYDLSKTGDNKLFDASYFDETPKLQKSGTTDSLNSWISKTTHLSVSVITILDLQETQLQMFCNYLLYKYFDLHKKKKNWKESIRIKVQDRWISTNAVHLWDFPFIYENVDCECCKKTLCWILVVDGCHPKFTEYAALVSSHVFLFTEKDKETFRETLNRVSHLKDTSNPKITVFPENMMARKDSVNTFINFIEKTSIQCLRDAKKNHISLIEFRKISGTSLKWIKSGTRDSDKRKVQDTLNSSKEAQNNSKITVAKRPTTSNKERSETLWKINNLETPELINQDVTKSSRENTQGVAFPLYNRIFEWVDEKLDIHNVTHFVNCVLPVQSHFPPTITTEILELRDIVVVYKNELDNMYDNYVCFSGTSEDKFLKLFDTACSHATKLLKSKKQENEVYAHNVMYKLNNKLRQLYVEKNALIIKHERQVTKDTKDKIVQVFRTKVHDYFTQNPMCEELLKTSAILKNHCIEMYQRILNFNDRYNTIASETLEILDNALTCEISSILNSYHLVAGTVEQSVFNSNSPFEIYLREFDCNIRPNLSGMKPSELKNRLEQLCKTSCSNMLGKNKDDVHFALQTHFNYALELHSQSNQNEINKKPICVYFKKDLLFAAICSLNNIFYLPWDNTTKQGLLAYALIAPDKTMRFGENAFKHQNSASKCDTILNFITKYNDSSISQLIIYSLFKWIREKALIIDQFSDYCNCALLVIPMHLTSKQRHLLRKTVIDTGYKNVYLVTESAVAVYNVMFPSIQSSQNNDDSFVMVFLVNIEGIRVEIFKSGNDITAMKQIYMIGASFRAWQKTNPSSPEVSNVECIQTLRSAYDVVVSMVGKKVNSKPASYILITDDPKNDFIFDPFFNEHPNWFRIHNWRNDIFTRVVLDLGREPGNITKRIVDHAVSTQPNNFVEEDFSDYLMVKNDVHIKSAKHELSKRKEKLLLQCSMIRKQIGSGEVKLRPLIKKLALEVITRVEATAKNDNAAVDMVEYGENEVAELVEEHMFLV